MRIGANFEDLDVGAGRLEEAGRQLGRVEAENAAEEMRAGMPGSVAAEALVRVAGSAYASARTLGGKLEGLADAVDRAGKDFTTTEADAVKQPDTAYENLDALPGIGTRGPVPQ